MKQINIQEYFIEGTFWQKCWYHLKPILVGGVAAIFWCILNPFIKIPQQDSYIVEVLFLIPIIPYAFSAHKILEKVTLEDQKIKEAFLKNNKDLFLEYITERVSPASYRDIYWSSGTIILLFCLLPLSTYTGVTLIFVGVMYMAGLYFKAKERDDPFSGIYKVNKEKINEKWPNVCDQI